MPYALQADIAPGRMPVVQLAQLTSDDNSGTVNVDVVADVLDAASGIVENYCRERYQLPLKQTNSLKDLTASIAVYKLYERRPGKLTETVRTSYQDAMKLLVDISTGKASLDQPVDDVEQTPANTVLSVKRKEVFTREKLRGLI